MATFLSPQEALSSAGTVLVKCGAFEMKGRARTLEDAGVSFEISPEFPWEF